MQTAPSCGGRLNEAKSQREFMEGKMFNMAEYSLSCLKLGLLSLISLFPLHIGHLAVEN